MDLQVAFLFSDTQIKDESFVEDLSNLINTYEVPNLLGSGDLAGIFENIRPRAKQANMDGSKDLLYNFFLQEVRASANFEYWMRLLMCPGAARFLTSCHVMSCHATMATPNQKQ
jgi:hypothetical protein